MVCLLGRDRLEGGADEDRVEVSRFDILNGVEIDSRFVDGGERSLDDGEHRDQKDDHHQKGNCARAEAGIEQGKDAKTTAEDQDDEGDKKDDANTGAANELFAPGLFEHHRTLLERLKCVDWLAD